MAKKKGTLVLRSRNKSFNQFAAVLSITALDVWDKHSNLRNATLETVHQFLSSKPMSGPFGTNLGESAFQVNSYYSSTESPSFVEWAFLMTDPGWRVFNVSENRDDGGLNLGLFTQQQQNGSKHWN